MATIGTTMAERESNTRAGRNGLLLACCSKMLCFTGAGWASLEDFPYLGIFLQSEEIRPTLSRGQATAFAGCDDRRDWASFPPAMTNAVLPVPSAGSVVEAFG